MSVAIPRELREAALSLGEHLKAMGVPDLRIVAQQDHLVVVGAGDWKARIPNLWQSWEVWHQVA